MLALGVAFFFARSAPWRPDVDNDIGADSALSPDDFLTTDEAAVLLRRTTKTLEQWRWQQKGPPYVRQSGRAIVYRRGDLMDWSRAKTVRHDEAAAA
jgi:hypothetical protein